MQASSITGKYKSRFLRVMYGLSARRIHCKVIAENSKNYLAKRTAQAIIKQPEAVLQCFRSLLRVIDGVDHSYNAMKAIFRWMNSNNLLLYLTRIQKSLRSLNVTTIQYVILKETMDKCLKYHESKLIVRPLVTAKEKISIDVLRTRVDGVAIGKDVPLQDTTIGPSIIKIVKELHSKNTGLIQGNPQKFNHNKVLKIIAEFQKSKGFYYRDYQQALLHFIMNQVDEPNRSFVLALLRPGLGKTTMLPAIIEVLQLICDQETKILVIMPTPFLASTTHAKVNRIGFKYDIKVEKITKLSELERVTFCSADKVTTQFIAKGGF